MRSILSNLGTGRARTWMQHDARGHQLARGAVRQSDWQRILEAGKRAAASVINSMHACNADMPTCVRLSVISTTLALSSPQLCQEHALASDGSLQEAAAEVRLSAGMVHRAPNGLNAVRCTATASRGR
jgi:hypothetical protein